MLAVDEIAGGLILRSIFGSGPSRTTAGFNDRTNPTPKEKL